MHFDSFLSSFRKIAIRRVIEKTVSLLLAVFLLLQPLASAFAEEQAAPEPSSTTSEPATELPPMQVFTPDGESVNGDDKQPAAEEPAWEALQVDLSEQPAETEAPQEEAPTDPEQESQMAMAGGESGGNAGPTSDTAAGANVN